MGKFDYETEFGRIEMETPGESVKNYYKRMAKVMIAKASGTAGEGAMKYKINLPNAWMNDMDVRKGHRTFVVEKTDEKTIKLTLTDLPD